MNATSLLAKVGKTMNKLGASDRVAYKRVYTRIGGDVVLGAGHTTSHNDTVLSPKPAVFTVTQQDLMSLSGTSKVQLNDQMMVVSAAAITRADLGNSELVIVMKQGSSEEEYGIESFTLAPFDGTAIAFTLLLRSKRRP